MPFTPRHKMHVRPPSTSPMPVAMTNTTSIPSPPSNPSLSKAPSQQTHYLDALPSTCPKPCKRFPNNAATFTTGLKKCNTHIKLIIKQWKANPSKEGKKEKKEKIFHLIVTWKMQNITHLLGAATTPLPLLLHKYCRSPSTTTENE